MKMIRRFAFALFVLALSLLRATRGLGSAAGSHARHCAQHHH